MINITTNIDRTKDYIPMEILLNRAIILNSKISSNFFSNKNKDLAKKLNFIKNYNYECLFLGNSFITHYIHNRKIDGEVVQVYKTFFRKNFKVVALLLVKKEYEELVILQILRYFFGFNLFPFLKFNFFKIEVSDKKYIPSDPYFKNFKIEINPNVNNNLIEDVRITNIYSSTLIDGSCLKDNKDNQKFYLDCFLDILDKRGEG